MTTEITITPGDPRSPEAIALLAASYTFMADRYPAEHNYQLDPGALARPGVSFFIARMGEQTVGCGAVATVGGHGEIKSMFVAPAARRTGLGLRLLAALEGVARDAGLAMLYLETGIHEAAAIGLYEKAGFARCGPFGGYPENPYSVFMEKRLD
jgi:putative acetyltransferase